MRFFKLVVAYLFGSLVLLIVYSSCMCDTTLLILIVVVVINVINAQNCSL